VRRRGARAGHQAPLLISPDGAAYVDMPSVGVCGRTTTAAVIAMRPTDVRTSPRYGASGGTLDASRTTTTMTDPDTAAS